MTGMPGVPPALRRVLARAVELAPECEESVRRHYGALMPQLRAEQQHAPLMLAPLRMAKLPRLSAALGRLVDVLTSAGLDANHIRRAQDARSLAELYAGTHYGRAMPLLYAYPADLAYFASRGLSVDATIDEYLTAPIVHELCHLGGELLNPHLDECIAGWLGVHVLPSFAYPEPGHDNALYASPWLAQIGAAAVRVFGRDAVLRAHAGESGALPAELLEAADALYWTTWQKTRPLHMLADTYDPGPWLALIVDGRDGGDGPLSPDRDADRAIVADALRAMCLETELVLGSFRTRSVTPVTAHIEAGVITTAPKSALDRVSPAYWVPPGTGGVGTDIVIATLEDIPALAEALVP